MHQSVVYARISADAVQDISLYLLILRFHTHLGGINGYLAFRFKSVLTNRYQENFIHIFLVKQVASVWAKGFTVDKSLYLTW